MATSKAKTSTLKTKMRVRELAAMLDRKAVRVRAKYLKDWAGDAEMLAAGEQDFKDLQMIAALMRQGKLSQAALKAQDVDTNTREDIPMTVWNFLEKY